MLFVVLDVEKYDEDVLENEWFDKDCMDYVVFLVVVDVIVEGLVVEVVFVVVEVIFVFVVVIDVGVDDDDDDIGNVKVKDDVDDDVVVVEGDDVGKSKFNDDDGKDCRIDCGNSGDDKEWDDNMIFDVDIEKNFGEDCGKEE